MFNRLCPDCNKELVHKSKKTRDRAVREEKWCRNCSLTEAQNRTEVKAKISAYRKGRFLGSDNPFFGRHHTDETKFKIVSSRDEKIWKSDSFRQKMSKLTLGSLNPMAGKKVYDIWVENYGEEIAKHRLKYVKDLQSAAATGKNNPMYGKPSPQGSGNGWCGWYKGWHFRSMRELSYMLNIIEANKRIWISAENKELAVPYFDQYGKQRTYYADFLLDGKILIEVKPLKMMSLPINQIKFIAARDFCEAKNLKYEVVDAEIIDFEILKSLCASGEVELATKWKERLDKWKPKQKKL